MNASAYYSPENFATLSKNLLSSHNNYNINGLIYSPSLMNYSYYLSQSSSSSTIKIATPTTIGLTRSSSGSLSKHNAISLPPVTHVSLLPSYTIPTLSPSEDVLFSFPDIFFLSSHPPTSITLCRNPFYPFRGPSIHFTAADRPSFGHKSDAAEREWGFDRAERARMEALQAELAWGTSVGGHRRKVDNKNNELEDEADLEAGRTSDSESNERREAHKVRDQRNERYAERLERGISCEGNPRNRCSRSTELEKSLREAGLLRGENIPRMPKSPCDERDKDMVNANTDNKDYINSKSPNLPSASSSFLTSGQQRSASTTSNPLRAGTGRRSVSAAPLTKMLSFRQMALLFPLQPSSVNDDPMIVVKPAPLPGVLNCIGELMTINRAGWLESGNNNAASLPAQLPSPAPPPTKAITISSLTLLSPSWRETKNPSTKPPRDSRSGSSSSLQKKKKLSLKSSLLVNTSSQKNRAYRKLFFIIPDLSVRFSALTATLKVSGFEELRIADILLELQKKQGTSDKRKKANSLGSKTALNSREILSMSDVEALESALVALSSPAVSTGINTATLLLSHYDNSNTKKLVQNLDPKQQLQLSMARNSAINTARDLLIADTRWSLCWCKRVEPDTYSGLLPYQKVNHFPGTWGIGRKDNLNAHLKRCMKKYGKQEYGFFPEAWLLPPDYNALKVDMKSNDHYPKPKGYSKNLYIVKQVAGSCGRGMSLLQQGSPMPKGNVLVQRYIHDPFLINGYKFDLRIYVVVTSFNPLRVYVFQNGLVRFATTKYPTAGLENDGNDCDNNGNDTQGAAAKEGTSMGGERGGWNPSINEVAAAPSSAAATGIEVKMPTTMKSKKSGERKMKSFCIKDVTAHLTNYAINKKSDKFVEPGAQKVGGSGATKNRNLECDNEEVNGDREEGMFKDEETEDDRGGVLFDKGNDGKGSKWLISDFKKYLEEKKKIDWAPVWSRIENVIIKTLLSVETDVIEQLKYYFPITLTAAAAPFLTSSVRFRGGGVKGGAGVTNPTSSSELSTDASSAEEGLSSLSTAPDFFKSHNFYHRSGSGITKCFELYGFDVLLREDLSPVLMEVNIMPSLNSRSALLDQRVKSNMIADMLTLTGIYPRKVGPNWRNYMIPSLPSWPLDIGLSPYVQIEREQQCRWGAGAGRDGGRQGGGNETSRNKDELGDDVPPWRRKRLMASLTLLEKQREAQGGNAATGVVTSPSKPQRSPHLDYRTSSGGSGNRRNFHSTSSNECPQLNLSRFPSESKKAADGIKNQSSCSSTSPLTPATIPIENVLFIKTSTVISNTQQQRKPLSTAHDTIMTNNNNRYSSAAAETSSLSPASSAFKSMSVYDMHPFFKYCTPAELEVILTTEEEYARRGHFKRIFPMEGREWFDEEKSLIYKGADKNNDINHKPLPSSSLSPFPPPKEIAGGNCERVRGSDDAPLSLVDCCSPLDYYNEHYRQFFPVQRPYNLLLAQWIEERNKHPPSWEKRIFDRR